MLTDALDSRIQMIVLFEYIGLLKLHKQSAPIIWVPHPTHGYVYNINKVHIIIITVEMKKN